MTCKKCGENDVVITSAVCELREMKGYGDFCEMGVNVTHDANDKPFRRPRPNKK